jgi:hypothetical protein
MKKMSYLATLFMGMIIIIMAFVINMVIIVFNEYNKSVLIIQLKEKEKFVKLNPCYESNSFEIITSPRSIVDAPKTFKIKNTSVNKIKNKKIIIIVEN